MTYTNFRLETDSDGIALVTWDMPGRSMNVFDMKTIEELFTIVEATTKDAAIKGVVVTSAKDAFSGGADITMLDALAQAHDDVRKASGDVAAAQRLFDDSRKLSQVFRRIETSGKPWVAAINGLALGGGLELAMRCHALVAVRGASLQFPEIMLGILPGLGGLVVPYRRWPAAAATFHGMIRRGDRLDADRAAALGIVGALTDDYPSLVAAAVAQVAALGSAMPAIGQRCPALAPLEPVEPVAADGARLSAEVVAIIDDAIAAAAAATTLPEALEIGYRAFGRSACTAAAREGIAAFQARRPPDFGRTG